jgi:predicted dehydrogenase
MLSTCDLASTYKCPVYNSIDELLSAHRSELDGVIVSTSHNSHFDIGIKVLRAGINVFMEKPMTTDPTEAKQLAVEAKRAGVIFMVNNSANWRENSQRAFAMVQAGEIGTVDPDIT